MSKVTITPKIKSFAIQNSTIIEECDVTVYLPNETEELVEGIAIYDGDSDFLIEYAYNDDGTLRFNIAPQYVEDLPALIKNTKELLQVLEYAVKELSIN